MESPDPDPDDKADFLEDGEAPLKSLLKKEFFLSKLLGLEPFVIGGCPGGRDFVFVNTSKFGV